MKPWYDVRDGYGRLFNTVRASNAREAMANSNQQAYRIGIHYQGGVWRRNPCGAYAELTPSGGVHPF